MKDRPSRACQEWVIRPFCMADYDAVLELWQKAGEGLEIRPSDRRDQVAKRCQRDTELFLVAESDGHIIGVIMGGWDGRRGWLHHLTVDAAHRGQGIAKSLVRAVEDELGKKGCLKINLLVREANHTARQVYRQLGYDDMAGILPMGKEL